MGESAHVNVAIRERKVVIEWTRVRDTETGEGRTERRSVSIFPLRH